MEGAEFRLKFSLRLVVDEQSWRKLFPASLLQIGGPFVEFYPRANPSIEAVLSRPREIECLIEDRLEQKKKFNSKESIPSPHPFPFCPKCTTGNISDNFFNWFLKKN